MRFDLGPDLAALKASALVRIDAEAEAARLAFVTGGAGQAMEYQATEAEGRALMAALQAGQIPDLADYPFIKAEFDAIVQSGGGVPAMVAVAQMVVGMAAAWSTAGSEIKRLRRLAKLRVEAASTPAEVIAASSGISWPAP